MSDEPREGRRGTIHEVSADFLRLNGSRQQFRNLLSARKKLGTMPPAYTRIDCSHESLDSAPTRPQGPVITVEDTGSQLQIHRGSLAVSGTVSLAENPPTECENGNGSAIGVPPASPFKRNNSRYGIPIDDCAVKMVYRIRSERLNTRVAITDRSLVLALVGIVFMVIDAELCGQNLFEIDKSHPVSLLIRTFVFLSTTTLLTHIVYFHANEISLELVDCGADDWRIVVTWSRIYQFLSEFVICSICPLPGTGELTWTFVEANRCASHHGSHDNYSEKKVPVDVLLSLLMILRVYLLGRFMVLHSKQFQDASTRTLAALNRIQVNFSFVMKTMLDQRPLLLLSVFTLFFWLATAWTFAQCERLGRDHETPSILYANALWFIAITFLLNGYGDIVPKTNCGRIIAIVVGIIGAIISSILIAVISKKILLSQGQRNVNHFMNDSRLTREQKEAAAKVLQQTWHIYKCQTNAVPNRHLRYYQRKFLKAIHEFRHIKNKIRTFGETSSNTSIQQMNRLMIELQNTMARLVSAQDEIRVQIEVLQRTVRNHFVSGDGSSQRIMFAESISDQGP
ncbi:hypothetical protein QR680_017498 [Steinernema hermaphroditum]|uniref:Calmodulin-binding domain-containing protein n=1 Tax=Steinernema hermaphroditum TaxID=289476 RepID=A0AA39LPF1_9BILA|nr:hypothetical protein QR680_017498 [Steinernema hermaphroditum]